MISRKNSTILFGLFLAACAASQDLNGFKWFGWLRKKNSIQMVTPQKPVVQKASTPIRCAPVMQRITRYQQPSMLARLKNSDLAGLITAVAIAAVIDMAFTKILIGTGLCGNKKNN